MTDIKRLHYPLSRRGSFAVQVSHRLHIPQRAGEWGFPPCACSRGALRAALVLGVKLLPGMGPPRGGKHGNVCAHGEEQAQQHWLPDKATLSSIITMGYAYKKEQANVIQSSQRRQFTDSFECCRKKEKPYGKLEQPVKCSRVNNSLQAAVETKTGSTAALPSSQLVLPTPG